MTWMPFLCLGTGLLISLKPMSPVILKLVDNIINVPLIALITGVKNNMQKDVRRI